MQEILQDAAAAGANGWLGQVRTYKIQLSYYFGK